MNFIKFMQDSKRRDDVKNGKISAEDYRNKKRNSNRISAVFFVIFVSVIILSGLFLTVKGGNNIETGGDYEKSIK